MARYFFDFHDHRANIDDVGTDCPNIDCVRMEANVTLTHIARDALVTEGRLDPCVVIVRDEARKVVYTATLTLSELWLEEPVG